MADKVKLKGVKVLLNQTGSDITIENPKRGGDTHLFPQWFEKKGNVQYLECTILNVTRAAGNLQLVIPSSMDTELTILYDGSDDFTFYADRGVERVAVVAPNTTDVLVEYLFPKISGGKIAKRIVGSLPAPPAETITSVTVTGSATPTSGAAETYSATHTGTATGVTYTFTTDDGSAAIAGGDITFNTAGSFTVTATATKAGATGSGTQGTLAVTAS